MPKSRGYLKIRQGGLPVSPRLPEIYWNACFRLGPVGYWSMEEAAEAETAVDYTGNHPGTYSGLARWEGSACQEIPGTPIGRQNPAPWENNVLTIPDAAALRVTTGMTYIIWTYRNLTSAGADPDGEGLGAKCDGAWPGLRGWDLFMVNSRLQFHVWQNGAEEADCRLNGSTVIATASGKYSMCAATFKPGEMLVYVGGAQDGQKADAPSAILAGADNMLIGNWVGGGCGWRGGLDAAALFNYCLTPGQINGLYLLGKSW